MKFLFRIYLKFDAIINKQRRIYLNSRLKHCGNNVSIDPTCMILVPENMEIGDNCLVSFYTTIYATYGIKIGDNTMISSNCGISSYNHKQHSFNRRADEAEDIKFSKAVVIGNNVWIGMNSCILPGVTIGDNSIIGSGSIVTKNIPSNEVWVGNPAKYIKTLIIN